MIFLRPTPEFIQWLKKYAKGRTIIDIGCGEGCLLYHMNKAGIKAYGIEPYEPFIPDPMKDFPTPDNILPAFAQNHPLTQASNMLLVIARPCHNGFAYETIKARNPKNEVLYISKPSSVDLDLDDIPHKRLKVPCTVGDEEEIVISIR